MRNALTRRQFLKGSAGAVAGLSLLGSLRGASAQDAGGAETIVFHNGIVLPVDAPFSEHEALAVRGAKVLAVGKQDAVLAAAGKTARVIDLGGRVVLPGFIEPHMHFALLAGLGHLEDIGPFKQSTFEGALEALRKIRESTKPDGWVMARQFDPILLEPPRDLTTRDLDKVVPDRPVFVLNASGHVGYVNSRALELAGITAKTPDPKGAEYGRYEDGSPNGVLYGPEAHLPVILRNPEIADRMQNGFVEAGRSVGDLAASLGITTLCDMATGAIDGPAELENYRRMFDGGRMKARIRAYLFHGHDWSKVKPGEGDELMRVAGYKLVTDGSNQGFTGRQREPFHTRDTKGIYYIEPKALGEIVLERARKGWPLALHGNGDAAIDSILDASEAAQAAGVDVKALRFRIEHSSILHDDQIKRIKALGMGPSFLINHVHYWGHVMRDQVFGPEKVQLLDRCRAVEEAGITWTCHSDAPVSPLGALQLVRAAVARDLWKEPKTVLAPKERVGVEAALRSVTINAAWQCHSEREIGSLERGKLADLVVLEKDPRKVEPKAIADIKVSQTWLGGQQVFGS